MPYENEIKKDKYMIEEKPIIKELEHRYAQYSMSDSDTMLYFSTKEFLNYLRSNSVVNQIINKLCQQYPFSDEEFTKYRNIEYFSFLNAITENREKYASFCFQYLEWGFKQQKFDTLQLYSEASWTCSNTRDYSKKEQIKLFQIDVVYNIVSIIIDELRKGIGECHALMRFGERAMRFKTLSDIGDENDLQDRLGLFLYDNGYPFSREENSGNGKADFLISDDEDFVVEVKFVGDDDEKCTVSDLRRWSSQLDDYMKKYSSRRGILYIVSKKDYEFLWSEKYENKNIMNVYIGNRISCRRNTDKIIL